MYIVTGGAGFIGSNIVKALNRRGINEIIVVDELTDGRKFKNLADCQLQDYLDKDEFLDRVLNDEGFGKVDAVFHEGACSTTTEWNGHFMLENNFTFSKHLLHYCQQNEIPLLYASSAAVYGGNSTFQVDTKYELPLNVYGYSKLLFDQYVRFILPKATAQIAGFRYFNVYGPREAHKDSMASVAFHFNNQLKETGVAKLFAGSDGYADGEQRRDFVFVGDVVAVNLWFLEHPEHSGIYNVGTGRSQTFNDVANAVIAHHGRGKIQYQPFPEHLKGHYQSFTQADISPLRQIGYSKEFQTVEQGVANYLDEINQTAAKEELQTC